MTPRFKLISHALCPYVQRAVITLEEKHIPYQRIDIDLAKPPSWFDTLSPMGKVPALIVDEQHILFESAVICEYLDEISEGSLHPIDPLTKAQHRSWIEFASQLLNNIAKLYTAQNEERFFEEKSIIEIRLNQLNNKHSGKAFFEGSDFHLIDAVYATVFRYFEVFEAHSGLAFLQGLHEIKHWQTNLAQRPSIQYAVSKNYGDKLIEFVINRQGYLGQQLQLNNRFQT